MNKENIQTLLMAFEVASQTTEEATFWYARDLQKLLGYSEWRNFTTAIDKAKEACKNSGLDPAEHLVDVNRMLPFGNGAEREVEDILLSRYACYLIAQNGDSRKPEIAFAQTYFAMQTRKQELIEKRLLDEERVEARQKLSETEKQLSGVLYEHGIDDKGFALVRSKGDEALFGGRSTQTMKSLLGVDMKRPLADFLPTITLKAKELAAAMTSFNVRKENMRGQQPIISEHTVNNTSVRNALLERGIHPEKLPAEEDIKKVARRMNKETLLPQQTQTKKIQKTNAKKGDHP